MTPKEIAAALRTATAWDDLAPLSAYIAAKRATGAPVVLEEALASAMVEMIQIRGRLLDRLADEEQAARKVAARVASGARVMGYEMGVQSNHASVVHLAELDIAKTAADRLIDVFEALADRITATPEEQANARAGQRERAVAKLAALPARDLRRMAKDRGLDVGTDRREIAAALVDAGHVVD